MAQGMPHEPTKATRERVRSHAAVGVTHETIAALLGVSLPTLYAHYREDLDRAAELATAAIAGRLYSAAMGEKMGPVVDGARTGDPFPPQQQATALIFWLKTRGGWVETERRELTGKDGGPIETREGPAIDPSKLTDEELIALDSLMEKARSDGRTKPRGGQG